MEPWLKRLVLSPQDTLEQAMYAMDSIRYGIVLVVGAGERLLGVVTDGDIRRALLRGADLSDAIGQFLTRDPVVLRESEDVDDAPMLELLQSTSFRERRPALIPVVDPAGRPMKLVWLEELLQDAPMSFGQPAETTGNHRVVIIGGAGYIGSVLVRHLLDRGYRVKVLDALLYGVDSLRGLKERPTFEFVRGDIRHIDTLVSTIQGASAVVHLAELVGDPLCASKPEWALQTNYLSTSVIARICNYLQINRFVYVSSCSVYGCSADPEGILDENSALAPVSLYARMKLKSERAILSTGGGNFAPCILRLGTVFGRSPRPRFDLVVNLLSAKAFFEREIQIFGGDQWRPHVHVAEVARAIHMTLEAPIDRIAGEIFNIVGENRRIAALVQPITAELPATRVLYDNRAVDRRNYQVSCRKAMERLGFHPSVTIADGIRELVRGFRDGSIPDYRDKRFNNEQALSEVV